MNGLTFHFKDAASRLAQVRGVIWDLDGTLYEISQESKTHFNETVATAAIALGAPLTLAEATAVGTESFARYRNNGLLFIERYAIDAQRLHFDYHAAASEHLIKPHADLPAAFVALGKLPHIILTHASRHWAERVIARLGLEQQFPPDRILAFEDFDFRSKHNDRAGFEMALKKLNLPVTQVAVVEDSVGNLKMAHEMGMLTIYLDYGQSPPPTPDFVDVSADIVQNVLRALTPG